MPDHGLADDTAYSLNDIADGVNAGFLTSDRVERWAEASSLDKQSSEVAREIARAIRDQRVEARIGKKVGQLIASVQLIDAPSFLGHLSNRHRFQLVIDPAAEAEGKGHETHLGRSRLPLPPTPATRFQASRILRELFQVLADRYIEPDSRSGRGLRLLPEALENTIIEAASPAERARLICDHISAMTDGFAVRTYKRLADPDFGSIVDLV